MTEQPPAGNEPAWHNVATDQTLKEVPAGVSGLSSQEATGRLQRYGPNALTASKQPGFFARLWAQHNDVLTLVLMTLVAVLSCCEHWIRGRLSLAISMTVASMKALCMNQEGKIEKAAESTKAKLSASATVVCDGKRVSMDFDQLVPSAVVIKSDSKVPADVRHGKHVSVAANQLVPDAVVDNNSDRCGKPIQDSPTHSAASKVPKLDMDGKFEFIKELGRGSFGTVVLACNTETGGEVAIKRMDRSTLQRYAESELLNHNQLSHPHVVQFHEVYLSTRHINIVMDYANNGSLFDYVKSRKSLDEPQARWFFQQLILAVDYCHRMGVANRDIKLENTLLKAFTGLRHPIVKICDFGYSKKSYKALDYSKVGTVAYMAPEVLMNNAYDSKTADIWSCGVVLYTMLMGQLPFQPVAGEQESGHVMVAMLTKVKASQYYLPDRLTPECKTLLRALLHPESEKRVKMEGIMADPWFKKDLPADALTMNEKFVAKARLRLQNSAEIKSLVAHAMVPDTIELAILQYDMEDEVEAEVHQL